MSLRYLVGVGAAVGSQGHVEEKAAVPHKRQRTQSDSVDWDSNDALENAEFLKVSRHFVSSPPHTRPRARISAPISRFNVNIQQASTQAEDPFLDGSSVLRPVLAQSSERSRGRDQRVIPTGQAGVSWAIKDKAKLSELISQLRSLSDDLDNLPSIDTEALAKATESVTKATELLANSRAIISSLNTRKTQELISISSAHENDNLGTSEIIQHPSPQEDDHYAVSDTDAGLSPNTTWDTDPFLSTDPFSFVTTKPKVEPSVLVRENSTSHDDSDTESDTKSVNSLFSISSRASVSSFSTTGTSQDLGDAGEELVAILLQDATLEPLYRTAIEKLGINNFAKLLRASAAHLSTEAQLTQEKIAAQFVKRRAKHVTDFISKHLDSNKDEKISASERRQRGSPEERSELDEIESDLAENSHGQTLGSVKNFILESSALVNLRDKLRFFVSGGIEESLKSSVVPGYPTTPLEIPTYKATDDASLAEGTSASGLDESIDLIKGPFRKEADFSAPSILDMIAKFGRGVAVFLEVREKLLRPGFRRIRWTCVCGAHLYDDFREVTAGSLNELEDFLNNKGSHQHTNGAPTAPDRNETPTIMSTSKSKQSVQSFRTVPAGTTSENDALPGVLRQRGQGRNQDQQDISVRDKTWVLPLFQYERYSTKVQHLQVDGKMSDETLFTMIKQQYLTQTSRIRRFFALRGVKKISYVKFIHAPREPDIHKFNDWPLQKHSPPWIYKGCPAKKKHIPLVGHTYLMHLWQNPSHTDMQTYRSRRSRLGRLVECLRGIASYSKARSAKFLRDLDRSSTDRPIADTIHPHPSSEPPRLQESGQSAMYSEKEIPTADSLNKPPSEHEQDPRSSYVLLRTPKKLGEQLLPDDEDPPEAWGLYFEEGFRVHHFLIVLLFLYILASLAFSVYWCVEYGLVGPDSGASAFGVASWMIAAVSLVVTVWFKWAD